MGQTMTDATVAHVVGNDLSSRLRHRFPWQPEQCDLRHRQPMELPDHGFWTRSIS